MYWMPVVKSPVRNARTPKCKHAHRLVCNIICKAPRNVGVENSLRYLVWLEAVKPSKHKEANNNNNPRLLFSPLALVLPPNKRKQTIPTVMKKAAAYLNREYLVWLIMTLANMIGIILQDLPNACVG